MKVFALFGAGRIGRIHAANIAAHAGARLKYVVDVDAAAAAAIAASAGAVVADAKSVLSDAGVDALLVASPTDTHAALIEAGGAAGKAILCEKPSTSMSPAPAPRSPPRSGPGSCSRSVSIAATTRRSVGFATASTPAKSAPSSPC